MRTISITIQEALYDKLKHSVPARKISKFVSAAISKELMQKEKELALAYKSAEKNMERKRIVEEWSALDDAEE